MKFKFVGGFLCLDFVNTVGGRIESSGGRSATCHIIRDKLAGFQDLVQWSEAAGVLGHREASDLARRRRPNPGAAKIVIDRAVALREALYRICRCCVKGRTPLEADLHLFNAELVAAFAHERLYFSRGRFLRACDEPGAPDRILWSVVRSAGEFFVSPALTSLRQCPGDECGWMFLDTSRNHSRRWCDMRICGNRAKIRRFRQA